MSGLQVFNGAGQLILDISTISGRILGSINISGNNTNTVLPIPGGLGTPFFAVTTLPTFGTPYGSATIAAAFSLSGTTLIWSFPFTYTTFTATVYYGVY